GPALAQADDDQRQREALRAPDLAALGKYRKGRNRDPMVMHQGLRQVFAARQHQAARIAAGIGHAHQLEIARDVVVVDDLAAELLEQAERHVRLPVLDLVTDRLELVVHAQRPDLVAGGAQGADDVVLGLPDVDFLLGEPLARLRGYQVRVDEHQYAQTLHSASHLRRNGPNRACTVLAVSSTVNSVTSLRCEPTARRFSSRHLAIMSSRIASRVSWSSPVPFATSSLIRARWRLMKADAACDRRCLGSAENSRRRSRS